MISRLLRIVLAVSLFAPTGVSAGAAPPIENFRLQVESCFRRVPCMDDGLFRYHRDTIRALNYTKMRVFLAFCSVPGMTADLAVDALQRLVFLPITFDQVEPLEYFVRLPDATVAGCWQLLDRTVDLELAEKRAVSALARLGQVTAADILLLIDELKTFGDNGWWAAAACFSISSLDGAGVRDEVAALAAMTRRQLRAAEQLCRVPGITAEQVLDLLPRLARLSEVDALNSTGFLSGAGIDPEQARWWLDFYFSQPQAEQARRFTTLADDQKSQALSAYSGGSRALIRTINDLHAITDRFGIEIRSAALVSGSPARLQALFARLRPEVRAHHQEALDQALADGRHGDAVSVLQRATALARLQTARSLTTANIYVLLAHGGELYDSSFRDILIPELIRRITKEYGGNSLEFIRRTDPENRYVSDFIVSCAQKGKLALLFPVSAADQKILLEMVVASALNSEQSLILFSATFETLLATLQQGVRTSLIDLLIQAIDRPDSTFSLQVRVILQWYLSLYPELLGQPGQKAIAEIVERYGAVEVAPYRQTDFQRWKEDGSLRSLSVFQNDDDGQYSYLSNCRHLIDSGYRPKVSTTLDLLAADAAVRHEAAALVSRERLQPGSALGNLYRLSVRAPVIVEWEKTVKGIRLSHALAVYQNPAVQQQLFKLFLQQHMEMFAQRGHSYWRDEQLLEPMRRLLAGREIGPDVLASFNRFLSIGSCGGLKVYAELSELFDKNVDIFATIGTGKAAINDPYNQQLFEIVAASDDQLSWDDIARLSAPLLSRERASDYVQPGSLPAILHKMMGSRHTR